MRNIVHIGAGGEKQVFPNTTYHFFEPREDGALSNASSKNNVNVYPIALSDYTGRGILNIAKSRSCSSFLEPNLELIKELQRDDWRRFTIESSIEVGVERLDNVLSLDTVIDELIIDTQGTELDVLKGAGELLYKTKKIICEVEFVQLYINQPLFSDISRYLELFGFKFIKNVREVKWNSKSLIFADALFKNQNYI